MEIQQTLLDTARELGAHDAAVIAVSELVFCREFRTACEQNSCGKYGRCWMCPPDVGGIDELIAQAKMFQYALVYQTVGRLTDSFDIAGMQAAATNHNRLAERLADRISSVIGPYLSLAAGACQICARCTRLDNAPCRYPSRAIASLEGYGIAVTELAQACKMNYMNGENTVTYFGVILYGGGIS